MAKSRLSVEEWRCLVIDAYSRGYADGVGRAVPMYGNPAVDKWEDVVEYCRGPATSQLPRLPPVPFKALQQSAFFFASQGDCDESEIQDVAQGKQA